MRIVPVAVSLLISIGAGQAAAQSTNEEALKAICLAEIKAYFAGDYERWQQLWLHDAKVTSTMVGIDGGENMITGWATLSAKVAEDIKNPPPLTDVIIEHFTARESGNLAWVEYDQSFAVRGAPTNLRPKFRAKRLLAKDGDQWKIASQVTIGDMSWENQLNTLGYQLLSAKKLQDALEVFKLNVRLHPQSWNVYDSLGEGYGMAGEKELAIQNYEKSLQLNPNNEPGKAALAKLRAK